MLTVLHLKLQDHHLKTNCTLPTHQDCSVYPATPIYIWLSELRESDPFNELNNIKLLSQSALKPIQKPIVFMIDPLSLYDGVV